MALGWVALLGACASPDLVRLEQTAATPQPTAPAPAQGPGLRLPDPQAQYPNPGLRPLASTPLRSANVWTLTPPVDLWDRIRRGFAIPDLDNDLVRDRERWYASRPDYLQRMTERGAKYLFHIVEELERRNMPTELALLPFIESAFNPEAISRAKAMGLWQFMPATGKTFDLRQNLFQDDRRDVMASTRAALDYLQKLYAMFGDWHLALAAYNWGEGSVSRAIAKNQKLGLGTGYTELKMPMETQFYVPKLQAVKNIVARPQDFAAKLPSVPNHPYFQTVELQRDIDVSLAARLAEISLEDFRALNPQANKPVLLAAVTPQILLPWDNATVFQSNLEAFNGDRLANWTAWIAPTTLSPAEAARRVNMSESELRSVNDIRGRMLIKAGSTLVVRRSGALNSDVSAQMADSARLDLAPEVLLRKVWIKVGKKDSLASIAQRHRVSPTALAHWNDLPVGASLKPGQSLVLMLPVKATGTRSAKARTASPQTAQRPIRGVPSPSRQTRVAKAAGR
ncbi:MAG: transglycosylase SLT domain-containing protein [Rhodoferax sp.]